MNGKIKLTVPDGERIRFGKDKIEVPEFPVITRIKGDGIGKEVSEASRLVFDLAVEQCYGKKRKVMWLDLLAGEESLEQCGVYLPEQTIQAIKKFGVAIKGPLTTPVGGGIRSLNVTLRQTLDLYACVRPVRWFEGIPAPVKEPGKLDVIIFRENTEDVYAGIEFERTSKEAAKLRAFLKEELNKTIRPDAGIGIKPMSRMGSQRLVKRAINACLEMNRKSVTIVHKGNIMKFTEGAFRQWGYEIAEKEFGKKIITEKELKSMPAGKAPKDKIIVRDRIADAMFHDLLIKPELFSVIASPNLNGDYLSDACAAQVGGLGIAPGANIGDKGAVFEATHGTAPDIAGKNIANPGSLILSGVMMFEYLGWNEPAKMITSAFEKTIKKQLATIDIASQMKGGKILGTMEFAKALIKNF